MTNKPDIQAHKPKIRQGYVGLMSIWLIPLIAIGIAGWLIFQSFLSKGPEISLLLPSAKGLEAGVTPLKYRDVTIGLVDRIEIPDDAEGIKVIVSVDQAAAKYLTDTARFWVVSPAISLEGVSGLETLLSGAYLEIDPGAGGGEPRQAFNGLATPPVITSKIPGLEYILRADKLGNVKRGTPILYKGLQVGKILGYLLSDDEQSVELVAFVQDPYTKLIQENTRFWDAGGVTVKVSTSGIEMGATSVATLLSGAIEFLPPLYAKNSALAKKGHEFKLFSSRTALDEAKYTERLPYILYFDGSVSGLSVGAAVEFKGIKIGTVREITLEIQEDTGNYFIPVLIDVEPQRLKVHKRSDALLKTKVGGRLRKNALNALIKKGLRARLKSANFLTGQLIVDLDLFPEKPARYVAVASEYQELPTLPTELEEITTSLTRLVEKIEKLPIDKLANSLIRTAEGLETIVNEGQLVETIGEYKSLAQSVRRTIDQVDKETLPRIAKTVDEGRSALRRVDETLKSATKLFETADATLSDGSPVKYELSVMMRELTAASRSVRNLADFLERNPNALLRGKK